MIHPELFAGMIPEAGARRIYGAGQGGSPMTTKPRPTAAYPNLTELPDPAPAT